MVISHRKRFVLLLPWKTASQTMSLRLEAYNESTYEEFYYFNPYLNRVVHQHITCAEFACLPESKLGYYLATFVRNPYDRVYSGFRQLQWDLGKQPYHDYPEDWVRGHVLKQLSENFAQMSQARFDFDRWVESLREEQVYEVGHNTSLPLQPSHYWTHVADRQVADFIGRVESFEPDFRELMGRLEIESFPSGNANVTELTGGVTSNPFGYRYVNRMNARSIDKINRLFRRDFELFAYERVGA